MKTNGTEGGGECEECERGRRHRQQRGEETASTTGGEEEAEARKENGERRREEEDAKPKVPGVPEGMDPETGLVGSGGVAEARGGGGGRSCPD